MIFAANEYDLEGDEGRKRPGHFTKKDLKYIPLGLLVFFIFATPIYKVLKDQRDAALCNRSLQEIGTAILLYAEQNDNSYPPAYMTAPNSFDPHFENGRVYSWVSLLELGPRGQFHCDASRSDERVPNANPHSERDQNPILESSYGFYGALSALPLTSVENPSRSAMIADSTNRGARDTYNPLPFSNGAPDGFMIGLDDSNFRPDELQDFDPNRYKGSKWPTRLAFPGTKDGSFGEDTHSRHNGGVHVLMADGHRRSKPLSAQEAGVYHEGPRSEIKGLWQVPYRN